MSKRSTIRLLLNANCLFYWPILLACADRLNANRIQKVSTLALIMAVSSSVRTKKLLSILMQNRMITPRRFTPLPGPLECREAGGSRTFNLNRRHRLPNSKRCAILTGAYAWPPATAQKVRDLFSQQPLTAQNRV